MPSSSSASARQGFAQAANATTRVELGSIARATAAQRPRRVAVGRAVCPSRAAGESAKAGETFGSAEMVSPALNSAPLPPTSVSPGAQTATAVGEPGRAERCVWARR